MPNGNPKFKYIKFPYKIRNSKNEKLNYTKKGKAKTAKLNDVVTAEDPCTLVEILNSATYAGGGKAGIVDYGVQSTRYEIEELCAWAATNCSAPCPSNVWAPPPKVGEPIDGKPSGGGGGSSGSGEGNAGDGLGAAQPTKELVGGHDSSAYPNEDAPPGEPYGPPEAEQNQEPNPAPHGASDTGVEGGVEGGTGVEGGDPVDLFRGFLTIHEADVVVPNTVIPLVLARTYHSGHPYPGPFGWNWDHNHNVFLRVLKTPPGGSGGDVARWNGNLREDLFKWNGASYDPPRGRFQKLEKLPLFDPNGEYVIKDVGGAAWYFGRPAGWTDAFRTPLLRFVDRFGNALEYTYNTDDKLEQVTCKPIADNGLLAPGPYHYIKFYYGNCGLLEKVTDSLSREYLYWHDPDIEHLVRVHYPATTDHPKGTDRVYIYAGLHLPSMLRHNITRVENGRGKIYLENIYDEDPSSWSYGHIVQQIEGGNVYRFSYVPLQYLPPHDDYVNVPTQRTEVLDPEGGLTAYTFNFRGNVLDRRTRLSKDGSYWITAQLFEYDTQGNQTRAQFLKDFEDSGGGTIVHVWGIGEARTYHHDHTDPRMRGLLKKVERLDGTMRETVWEGTYDPNLQILLTEKGMIGDGFNAAAVTTTYQYSADNKGKLKKIIHPSVTLPDSTTQNAETQFETNTRGQTTAVITPEGIRHELQYSETAGLGLGRLLKKIADVGGIAAEQSYSYDSNGFMATSTDPTGAVTTYTYNILGQIERVDNPTVNGSTAPTVMHYDADGMLVEVHRPRGSYSDATITGSYIVDRIVRDMLGHVVSSEIGANTETPRRTDRVVDHRGLPVKSTDPLGTVSRWKWDERGLLFYHEVIGFDKEQTQEKFVYTRDGRVQQEIYGNEKDTVVEHIYGPFGRIARVHHLHRAPDGSLSAAAATARSIWSERGLLERSEVRAYPGLDGDTLLARSEFKYDARGRLLERTERPFSDASPFNDTTTPKLTTKYFYDRDDRLVKMQDPRGGLTTYKYDGLNRMTEEQDPLGNKTVYTYSFVDRSTEIEHHDKETDGITIKVRKWKRKTDARGRLVEVIEPDGASTKYEYDDRDLVTAVVERDNKRREFTYGLLNELTADIIDPSGLNIRNERFYDLTGRMVEYKDPAGQVTSYSYDGIGRVTRIQQPGEVGPRTMTYGTDGRLVSSRLPSGITFGYTYDTAGRMATMSASNVPVGIDTIPQHSYSYDLIGRLTSATAGSATATRAYDSLGRLLKETTHGEMLEAVYNDLAGTVVRKWPDGRQETMTTNLNGVVTKIERTAAGGLGAGAAVLGNFTPYGPSLIGKAQLMGGIETLLSFDERKRISQIKHDQTVPVRITKEQIDYRYNTVDRRRGEVLSTGTVQSRLHKFDERFRLAETREGSAAIALGTTGYSQANNDTDITAIENALNAQNPAPIKYEYLFTQLTSGKADERLSFRKTDSAGTVTTTSYTYQNGHRVSAVGAETVTHLADGTRQTDSNNRYDVDALGRIVRVKDPTGATTRTAYEYDPFGRVASITPAAAATRKLSYFGGSLLQERETAGVVRQFSNHPGLPGPMAVHVNGETYQMLYDARMNLLAVTDNAGTVKQNYRYEPFGTPTPTTSTTGIEPRFGGMRWMNDTSVYWGGARMMDPRHGLWLGHDPLGYADSPNLYAYAAQNPIDYADPLGLSVGGMGGGGGNSDGSPNGGAGGGTGMGPGGYPGGAGGTGGGGTANGGPKASGVSGRRSLFYGPGDGPGIQAPGWMMDVTEFLRNTSNQIRSGFAWLVDNTLGRLGVVGEFLGGFTKRLFDYALMVTPYGFAVWEEEIGSMGSMFVLVVDAMFSPDPARYQRLGQVISAMPEHFAHMSAAEWGSLTADALPALITGGAATGRAVLKLGERAVGKMIGRALRSTGKQARKLLARLPGRTRAFYSVQNPANKARLLAGGEPWPTGVSKSNLGEGFYAWENRATAERYMQKLQGHGADDLGIIEGKIKVRDYNNLKTLDLRTKTGDAIDAWMENFSLYGEGKPHGFEHVIRETGNFGPEFFFSKDIFHLFRF